jgi:hypothetical protein
MSGRVVDKGDDEFLLKCEVCGKVSMTFKKGKFYGKDGYIFTGITHQCALSLEDIPKIRDFLRKDSIKGLHKFVKAYVTMEDGLDGYCPECDKVYCTDHVRKQVEWDDGFYDCTYGVCPQGHRRIIDD